MSGFQFPPPPPPPPATSTDRGSHGDAANAGGPGRGRGRGQGRGRGGSEPRNRGSRGHGTLTGYRGHQDRTNVPGRTPLTQSSFQRPSPLDSQSPQRHTANVALGLPAGSYINPAFHRPSFDSSDLDRNTSASEHRQSGVFNTKTANGDGNSPQRTAAGHKRKLEALRDSPAIPKQPDPPVAPSIPTFGLPILSTGNHGDGSKLEAQLGQRRTNRLGLTPGNEQQQYSSDSDEDEDLDEEAMHAELGANLTFEHNGTVLSLHTAADLAAWRNQRRRNFPTRQRLLAKQEEKRQMWESRKRLLTEASRALRMSKESKLRPGVPTSRGKMQQGPATESASHYSTAVCNAPEGGEGVRENANTAGGLMLDIERDAGSDEVVDQSAMPATAGQVDDAAADPEDSNNEEPPEEENTSRPTTKQTSRVCKYFAASGYCRDGDACLYRHKLDPRLAASRLQSRSQQRHQRDMCDGGPENDGWTSRGRKTILDRLVEQEQGQEDRLALQAIKHLGEIGLFGS